MFERRLKIFLGILIGITAILLLRAAHLQLANGEYWRKQAAETLRRRTLIEPIRGDIVDLNGNLLATDTACIDAAVDYRAIDEDPKWLKEQATSRLVLRMGSDFRRSDKPTREKLVVEETARVQADIANMWKVLAQISGKSLEDIEEIKNAIRLRIDMRQRSLWYRKYQEAVKVEDGRSSIPWYKDWRLGGKSNPDLEKFNVPVSEQTEAHVIVSNISTDVHNQLKKRLEQYPGLVLRNSKHRHYPYGEVACHIIGHLAAVEPDDIKYDPNKKNELVEYYPNDKIGRSGIEAMCELTLRGQRGRLERLLGHEEITSQQEAVQGKTVKLTIDIQLQAEIENAFKDVVWKDAKTRAIIEEHEMHGAAIVIDVPTGEVRALVSYPTYDLNHLDELYASLSKDYFNKPLVNRATQGQYEPGSTVKPIVGAGAVSHHVIGLDGTVECTGFLVIDGRRLVRGRCWTASNQFQREHPNEIAHHQIGRDPHPTGFLNLTDAIQRSCNVYFENMGDHLGLDGLSYWFSQFGLGRKTEIGLPESTGLLPNKFDAPASLARSTSWFAAIGQGQILVTPLQMANVAATIARDGIWVRPHLLIDPKDGSHPTTRPTVPQSPDRLALPISSEVFAAVQEGMFKVVNTYAGSAYEMHREEFDICGKTGTAQAHKFSVYKRDNDGNLLYENEKKIREFPAINIPGVSQNLQLPWYRGAAGDAHPHHGWFIGYAPRQNPKVAFAIMIEYGGNGGHDAAPISNAVIDACIKHGYLH